MAAATTPVTAALTPFPLRLRGYSIDVQLWPGSAKLRVHRSEGCRDESTHDFTDGRARRHAGCPFAKARGFRQAVSAATGSLNLNKRGNATKTRLTGADAFDIELFAAHSVPRDEIPRLMHRRKGGRRQDHSLALGATHVHPSMPGDPGVKKR